MSERRMLRGSACLTGIVARARAFLFRKKRVVLGVGLALFASSVFAQAPTKDPAAWRPLFYANLQQPGAREATYFDIWADAIADNNRAYVARGDRRFLSGNAPVTEGHFVIWSPKRSVVVSILNTALGCSRKSVVPTARASIKLCPMRVAIFERLRVETMEAGRACLIEPEPGVTINPAVASTYGSYDVASRTVKLGTIVDHRAVDGCSFNLPIGRN